MQRKRTGRNKKELESSIRGFILRQLIAHVTSEQHIGQKFKSGELRKNLVEAKWKCPSSFHMEEIQLEHFTMELLTRRKDPRMDYVLLQLHGGGYIGAMRNAYRSFATLYSEMGRGLSVLTIDYRVAPENPYPAALEDAVTAYQWLVSQGWKEHQIVVAGDSAGGGLALALCQYLKDHQMKLPAGIIAMSPWTDLTASGPSYQENYHKDPLFGNSRDTLIYNRDYVGDHDPKDPYISPAFGDYEGFPPMLIQVGSIEMLLSDSVTVARKAKAAGSRVRLTVYEGMFHIFQMAMKMIPESRDAWAEIGYFLMEVAPRSLELWAPSDEADEGLEDSREDRSRKRWASHPGSEASDTPTSPA